MPDGSYSVSDIQYYADYIIKKHKTLTTIVDNRLVFKIKDKCKLELQTSEAMKFFGCTKIKI